MIERIHQPTLSASLGTFNEDLACLCRMGEAAKKISQEKSTMQECMDAYAGMVNDPYLKSLGSNIHPELQKAYQTILDHTEALLKTKKVILKNPGSDNEPIVLQKFQYPAGQSDVSAWDMIQAGDQDEFWAYPQISAMGEVNPVGWISCPYGYVCAAEGISLEWRGSGELFSHYDDEAMAHATAGTWKQYASTSTDPNEKSVSDLMNALADEGIILE
jgi:hypothetical protein